MLPGIFNIHIINANIHPINNSNKLSLCIYLNLPGNVSVFMYIANIICTFPRLIKPSSLLGEIHLSFLNPLLIILSPN